MALIPHYGIVGILGNGSIGGKQNPRHNPSCCGQSGREVSPLATPHPLPASPPPLTKTLTQPPSSFALPVLPFVHPPFSVNKMRIQ